MSIQVSGGGNVAVTTEAMLGARGALVRLAAQLEAVRQGLRQLEGGIFAAAFAGEGSAASASVLDALPFLARASRYLDDAGDEAGRLCAELELAAEEYGVAERKALAVQQFLSMVCGPVLAFGRLGWALSSDARKHAGKAEFDDPELLAALRGLVDSMNVTLLAAVLQALPGPELEETPVVVLPAVVPKSAASVTPPRGFADLARRIPSGGDGDPQVRVERYELSGGEVHWLVYIGGTVDWSPLPGDQPWDLTSNVVGVGGMSAGSTRAAMLALRAAGWQPGDAVVPVGHSQGGIVATAIATSGLAPAPMVVTFGSPTAGVPVPSSVLAVAVEHTDDLVPVLGGSPLPLVDPRLLVRESASAGPQGAPPGGPHAMPGYRQTAAQMDTSSDDRLVAARARLADFTGGEQAQVTLWRGERVSAGPAG